MEEGKDHEMLEKKVPHYISRWTMNKKMIYRFFLNQTHDASICQIPPSTPQVIKVRILSRTTYKETNFWGDA